MSISRSALAATALAGALLCHAAAAKETLRVLAWPGYADPDLVQEFERRHDVEVQVTYIDSDDQMWARMSRDAGADFDLFAVNTAELQRYIEAGISVPIRVENILNRRRQLARFQDLASIPGVTRDGTTVYAIPYTYSAMGLIYDRGRLPAPPSSMEVMWDPAYRGQVLAFDTSNHNFSIAALLSGMDPFDLDDEGFHVATLKLIELRRNVLTFYRTPEEVVRLFGDNEIALVFANYGTQQLKQLREAGADIGYVIPREGALAWLDCWAMSRGARDRALAEAWIDYMLEDAAGAALSERQGLANTTAQSPTTTAQDRIIWLEPLEDYARREELWSRIRSGDPPEAFR